MSIMSRDHDRLLYIFFCKNTNASDMNSSNEVSVELRSVYAAVQKERKKSGENILILDIFCVIFSLGRGEREKKSEKFRLIFLSRF